MTAAAPRLLLGNEHPCSYLPGREARSLFVDPHAPLTAAHYGQLLALGFRRSGRFIYRPACADCQACQPLRLDVEAFAASRSQKRCRARNRDLSVTYSGAPDAEHFALYGRYLRARHADGGMDPADHETFESFLDSPWASAATLSIRDPEGPLVAGGVLDEVPGGLSAVYTYFDPCQPRRGLGTFAVLMAIERARALGHRHLYLGYWVGGSRTMAYKQRFRPHELLSGRDWIRTETASH